MQQAAAQAVGDAAHECVQYLQASYMGGDISGTTGSLLTAQDPTVAARPQDALEQYQADKQINAMGTLQRATVAKSNADAAARLAVRKQTAATKAAKAAKLAADGRSPTRQAQAAAFAGHARDQAAGTASRAVAAGHAQWSAGELRRVAGQVAAHQATTWRRRLPGRAARIAEARAASRAPGRGSGRPQAAERARLAAAAQNHHSGSSGGSSAVVGRGPSRRRPASDGSLDRGRGPGRGAPRDEHARRCATSGPAATSAGRPTAGAPIRSPACGVVGYDCSGLVLYAWGRGWDHYAASQYSQAGSRASESAATSSRVTCCSGAATVRRGGIGHVAIYIGHGDVIQAPQSGDVVRITPWDQVECGYSARPAR